MAKKGSENVVTIKDIATMCGVSISTVSNVLNGKTKKVSEEMAKRINDAVQSTGYKPNVLAKSLRATSTKTIGIIAEDLIVFSAPSMIEGIMGYCEERGYTVIIENMRLFGRWAGDWLNDEGLFQAALQPALSKMDLSNVDGIIYIAGHEHTVHKLKSSMSLPIVMTYATAEEDQIISVRLDDVSGGYEVFKYLLSKGHERIGVIAGEINNNHTINRIIGIQQAMFEAGRLFDPAMIEYQHWNREGGYAGMKALSQKGVTAVFCMSDIIASGAYAYLKEIGMEPGKDISIVGYDNQEISTYLSPQVTTMALPLEEIGRRATEELFGLIENPEMKVENYNIKMKAVLVERESVSLNAVNKA